ncbi:MAG: bifunctional hydroxymethylpyrimidine kinase/phosphomethylpyrimidine kinase [Thermoproteota archaeon]
MEARRYVKVAMTIAGSDSGGGAGIQADLKTFAAMGVHGTTAITSITAQNTYEVRAVHDVPPDVVVAQIEAVADDLGIDAAKTGMLSNADIIRAVAKTVDRYGFPLVVDPVMIAKSGAPLLREDAMGALIKEMISRAWVVTPNRMEAERILGTRISSIEDAREAARRIVEELGAQAAIVKGGHLGGEYSVDVMYYRGRFYEYKAPRIDRKTTHGTGCSFSAAIAAGLAKGRSIPEAVDVAKKFITMAIEYGLEIGRGHGPVNPSAWVDIPAERYRVLVELEEALLKLEKEGRKIVKLVPEVGMNLGYALPKLYARGLMDVAAVPGRISVYRDTIFVPAKPEFGVSRHVAAAILTAMEHDPDVRSAANIVLNPEVESAVKRLGFSWSFFDRREEPEDVKKREGGTTRWGIQAAIRRASRVPDLVFDYGEHGKEPLAFVFGRTPAEVVEKMLRIAAEV